ncbi:MAG: deoxyguanosinetriphosphate triphosphohydrolase [Clostridia bacterium]|nr:deoxyguanosinetriphosphate triphosphohydrolase [Clostridia bacterium]
MTVREILEAREKEYLSSFAAHSCDATREYADEECDMRTAFQRDRDRILHCNSFRRLKRKTQVFLSPEGDHYRTRLTHTLEVAQIARSMARALNLNEDLAEAAALGHDLGHTPFGHAGERALAEVCPFGFYHYEQSVRVVTRLEKMGRGLNLTRQTIDAIGHHSGDVWAQTLEGQIVRYADKIAYANHDIDDAIRGGVLENGDVPFEIAEILGGNSRQRLNTMIRAVVEESRGRDRIEMEKTVKNAHAALLRFMFDNVYISSAAKTEERKAEEIVKSLYRYFAEHPEQMPEEYQLIIEREGIPRAACDYISGMTDNYAVSKYSELYLPTFWMK